MAGRATTAGDARRFGHVGHAEGDRLGVGQLAVADLHDHVVAVVAVRIGRRFMVWRHAQAQLAGAGIDAEQAGIRPAGQPPAQRAAGVGVGGLQRQHGVAGRCVLSQVQAQAGRAAATGDARRFRHIVDAQCQRLGVGQHPIADLHDQVVAVVAVRIRRGFMIGRDTQAQLAGAGVDAEQAGIGAARQPPAQRAAGVVIGGAEVQHRALVFVQAQAGGRCAAQAGDARRVGHIAHLHAQGLPVAQAAVAGLHDQVVLVVAVGIARGAKARCAAEAQHTGGGIDAEQRGIGAPHDAVDQTVALRVTGHHRAHRHAVLIHRQHRAGATAPAADAGRFVEVAHAHLKHLGRREAAIAGLHHHLIDVVATGVHRRLVVRCGHPAQHAGAAVHHEAVAVGAADDPVADRIALGIHRLQGADQ